jgi:L-lysine 2,3-aminomutase
MTPISETLEVPIKATELVKSKGMKIRDVDVQTLMDRHSLSDDARNIIEKENLIPTTLLSRLHNNYPQHSGLLERTKPIFETAKSRYSGLEDFKEICNVLKQNGIKLGHIKERELFIEVYRFLATKHVLNTIDWSNFEADSVFQLVFPQPGMINKETVKEYCEAKDDASRKQVVLAYMERTNPHDGKQMLNRASFYGEDGDLETLEGSQHKYPQCILLFDKTTQSCYAFCSYCFRHAQVRGDEDMFIQNEVSQVHTYLKQHKEITDVLITGGDAGFMPYDRLNNYLSPIMDDPELMHIRNIRIASRALTYHPEIILTSNYDKTLALFKKLCDHGVQVHWVGHFSTPKEIMNVHTLASIRRLRAFGILVKSQSPMMNHISLFKDENGKVDIDKSAQNWIDLAHLLMMLGIGFHSMYCARPTGEHHYFTAPLADMNRIFSKIYRSLPSIGRPSRYITMTSSAGKTSLLGTVEVNGKKAFVLKFNEARNMEWIDNVYLAEYDEEENTIEKLKPFDSNQYFYEKELEGIEKGLEKKQ